MKTYRLIGAMCAGVALSLCVYPAACAQEGAASVQEEQVQPVQQEGQTNQAGGQQLATMENASDSENVTLDFKEADIRNVLKIISMKAGVNIITTAEVIGNVTVRLVDVPWEQALDAILKTHGFAYDKKGNIIIVAPVEKLTAQRRQEVELAQVQPTVTEVFVLKFLDAQDAQKALQPQMSPRGRITILEMTGQSGWEFGGMELGKRKRAAEARMGRSKVLIVSDIVPAMDRMRKVIEQIDVKPQQVLIEARIMEVSRDKLRDIGFDWGTGATGAEGTTITSMGANEENNFTIGGHLLGSQVKPSAFGPKAADITGLWSTFNTGISAVFRKVTGTQFEVLIHALEEEADANTLSSPRVLALNNQEASILVGTRYPILKTEAIATTGTPITSIALDYYQEIGIQLNVVPQVGKDNYINMVIHPAVTSFTQTLSTNSYPIIEMREAETRIMLADGETVVIGGLLKDVKTTSRQGIPFLSKIPLLGVLFSRDTVDTGKIDLLIFITAHVVKEGEFSPEEITALEKRIQQPTGKKSKKKK